MSSSTRNSEVPRIVFEPSSLMTRLTRHPAGQCDACSPLVEATSPTFPADAAITTYLAQPDRIEQSLDTTGYTMVVAPAGGPPAVLNASARAILHHFAQPRSLTTLPTQWDIAWGRNTVDTTLHQLTTLGFLVPPTPPARALREAPTTLAAWLHLTDRCTLRCAYCYLPHAPADMTSTTGRAAIDATIRSALTHGYRHIKLKYAGGEPLLRFALLANLQRYALAQAKQYGLTLDGVVLSNGTLLCEEHITQIQELGLRLTLSLDGLDSSPNHPRRYTGGQSAAPAVVRAIKRALAYGLVPSLSITVSGQTVDELPNLLTWVLAHDLPFSLNFYRVHDRCPQNATLAIDAENSSRMIRGMLAAYRAIEAHLPRHSLLDILLDRVSLVAPHRRPCSAGHSYLVFDPHGHVALCQMHMQQHVATVSDDDPLAQVRSASNGLQNPVVEDKPECRECAWRYWCAGGCPITSHHATGRYNASSPNCEIYSVLLPEVLRLEGLRLLKWAVLE